LLGRNKHISQWVRKFVGADEYINSYDRYCLWLVDATAEEIEEIPEIKERVESVRLDRLASQKKETREKAALIPHLFPEIRQPKEGSYLLVPRVTSERRKYVPIGYLSHEVITSNQVLMVPQATLYEFGILTSEMHNDWMRAVAGRLKSDYRYSASLGSIRIFVGKAVEQLLSPGLGESVAEHDGKLIHRGFPIEGCPHRFIQHVA
jgi:hypothetical protein